MLKFKKRYNTAALKKSEADKAALAHKLAKATNIEPKLPCPVGNFNIQEAMGLTGSKKRRDQYMAIAVCLRFSFFLFLMWLRFDQIVAYCQGAAW
ncbi:hypothetical protein BYT27DRAFT_7190918 [Phlegmacium glaucopus]|nr:hypothetical protein BYT27DRAFT_7190918 [Phlegmacium glaucopus]